MRKQYVVSQHHGAFAWLASNRQTHALCLVGYAWDYFFAYFPYLAEADTGFKFFMEENQ